MTRSGHCAADEPIGGDHEFVRAMQDFARARRSERERWNFLTQWIKG